MKKVKFILAIFILLAIPLYASEKVQYTYDELYSSMILNNNRIKQSDQDIYNSQLLVKDAKSLYQPNIGYSLYGVYMANPPIDKISMSMGELLGQAGIPILPESGLDGINMNQYVTLYDGMENTYYGASISLTQPLITMGKIPLSVKIAKTASSVQDIKKSGLLCQLETELNIRLYTLYYIDEIYDLIDKAQEDADELVSIAQKTRDNEIMSEQDLLDAKIQAQEIDVQKAQLDSQYKNVLQGVRTLVGIPDLEFEDISFCPDESFLRKFEDSSIDSLKSLATKSSNKSLQMINKMQAIADLQEDLAWRSIYGAPDVLMNISVGYGGSRFPFAEIGWRQADDWNVNVVFTVSGNIWDGGRSLNSIDRAKSSQLSAQISYDSTVQSLESLVEYCHNAMQLSLAKIDYLNLKSDNEKIKLDKIELEMEQGQKSRKDVLEQETELIKTNVELATEKISLAASVFVLDYLTTN